MMKKNNCMIFSNPKDELQIYIVHVEKLSFSNRIESVASVFSPVFRPSYHSVGSELDITKWE